DVQAAHDGARQRARRRGHGDVSHELYGRRQGRHRRVPRETKAEVPREMKAWRVHAWGEPETMTLEEVPDPQPASRQVRVANRVAALNFFDILQVQGKYQVKPPFPFTPGAEVAGVVDAIGDRVTSVKPGDRVMAMPHGGGFAEK